MSTVLFALRVEYPTPGHGATAHTQQNAFRFEFLSHSAFKWVVPETDAHAAADDDDDHNNSLLMSATAASAAQFDHEEYSVKFSNVAKRPVASAMQQQQQQQQQHAAPVEIISCLLTFERFLEARVFARQMHWILQVMSPNRTADSFAAIAAGSPSACALVALPVRWWFDAWKEFDGTPSSSNGSGAKSAEALPAAFVLSSSGPAETVWHVRDYDQQRQQQQQQQQRLDDDDGGAAATDSVTSLLGDVGKALPLLESPSPTPQSETSALQWAACYSPVVLATAMDGATMFQKAQQQSQSQQRVAAFDPVPVCYGTVIGGAGRSAAAKRAEDEQVGGVSSRNICMLRAVQPVLLEASSSASAAASSAHGGIIHQQQHHAHRLVLAGKNGGLTVVQLGSVSAAALKSGVSLLRWRCVPHRRATAESPPFVAMPLQDAVLEASNQQQQQQQQARGADSAFVIGASSSALSAVCRVLCVAGETHSAPPRPVVFNTRTGSLQILSAASLPAAREGSAAVLSWAATLVHACCAPGSSLLPVTLLPLRSHPAFVAPPSSSSGGSGGGPFVASPPAPSSLESILLLSAMRQVANSVAELQEAARRPSAQRQQMLAVGIRTAAPLHSLRAAPRTVNVSVVGAVGVDTAGLIAALCCTVAPGSAQSLAATRFGRGGRRAFSQQPMTAAAMLASSSSSASFGGGSHNYMTDWLIFGCRCPTCADSASSSSSAPGTTDARLVRAQLVEAPPHNPHAMAGIVAASDIVLLVVDCLSPHSLSWLEDETATAPGGGGGGATGTAAAAGYSIRQILLERRAPTLSLDRNRVQIGGPTAIIVTINSGSYRRTVTQEQVAGAADRLKCLEVAELDFGPEDASAAAATAAALGGLVLSPGDARVVTGTLGRAVQACAAYGRLVDHGGFLPVQAEWAVAAMCAIWQRHFALAAQIQDEEEAAAGHRGEQDGGSDQDDDDDAHRRQQRSSFGRPPVVLSLAGMSSAAQQQHTWLSRDFFHGGASASPQQQSQSAATSPRSSAATTTTATTAAAAAGFVDETLCDWFESDMRLSGACRYSVADVACYLANSCAARDMRGQFVKMLVLKRAVSLAHAVQAPAAQPVFGSPTALTLRSARRSCKMARKLFALVTHARASSPSAAASSPRSPIMSATSTARAAGTAMARGATDRHAADDDNDNAAPRAGGGAASSTPRAGDDGMPARAGMGRSNSTASFGALSSSNNGGGGSGLSPAALLYLLSTFGGVVVSQRWIDALWAETSRVRLGNDLLSLNTWLRLVRLHEDQIAPKSGQQQHKRGRMQQHQSMFTLRQMTVADFSLVALRWMVEVAKAASTQLLVDARDGWVSSSRHLQESMMGTPTSSSAHDGGSAYLSGRASEADAMMTRQSSSKSAVATASTSHPAAMMETCRSCKKSKPDSELVRCAVCERHCCVPPSSLLGATAATGSADSKKNPNPCCLFVGRRDADQQRNALLALLRTSSSSVQQQTQLLASLKKLPHVCRVCLLSHAPMPWQADGEAHSCFCCGQRFSLTFRRHHCRDIACGRVVCKNCSPFEAAVFGYPTPERICIGCYNKASPFVPLSGAKRVAAADTATAATTPGAESDGGGVLPPPLEDDDDNDDADDPNEADWNGTLRQRRKRGDAVDDDDGDAASSLGGSSFEDLDEADDAHLRDPHRRRSSGYDLQDKDSEDDDDDYDDAAALGAGESIRDRLAGSDAADPRVVFAPWAHLVLNGEPDTVFRQPWYETIDETVVEDVLRRAREMARDAVQRRMHVPRAEYVVRQPGFLQETDAAVEDAALGGNEWPAEFEPDD